MSEVFGRFVAGQQQRRKPWRTVQLADAVAAVAAAVAAAAAVVVLDLLCINYIAI